MTVFRNFPQILPIIGLPINGIRLYLEPWLGAITAPASAFGSSNSIKLVVQDQPFVERFDRVEHLRSPRVDDSSSRRLKFGNFIGLNGQT